MSVSGTQSGLESARQVLGDLQAQLAIEKNNAPSPHPDIPNARAARAFRCRACKANAGESCTNRGTGRTLLGYHHSRLADAGLVEPEKPFDPVLFAQALASARDEPPLEHTADNAKSCPICGECSCAMTEASQASCKLHGIGSEHTL
jgi:hypothetical protein